MKKLTKSVLPLLISLVICSCTSVEYKDASLSSQLNYSSSVSSQYRVDNQWWSAYQDQQLNQLVDMALANNVDLAQSALTMQKAMYQANLSELDLYPTLSGDVGASASRNTYEHDSFSQNRSFSGELSLSYEVDLWRKLSDSAQADKFEYQATYFDKENTRLTLINSVIDVYFNLAYLNNAVNVTQNSLNNYQQMQDVIAAKYQNGKTDELDLLQVKQTIKTDENSLLTYQTQIKDNEQVLRNLLNLPPSAELNIHYPDMLTVKKLTVDLDVPLSVLANRPDLKASELRLQEAFKDLEAQNKAWYPSITLKTALSSSDSQASSALDFPVLLGSVSINLPFLSWNTVKNNINIAKTDYESRRLDFASDINTALNEVAYYYAAYVNNQAILGNTQVKYQADLAVLKIYDDRYRTGKVEFKDLLDNINTVNTSKLSLLDESYQLIKYENMIFKAMAGRYQSIHQS
ncbi:TolC family protein [Orbus sasakiae]|uniref:TolC family protein n=1 Tax=Orbus sasakiae TaxID=1078475 RepID=A0ABP9N172_9GAMM